MNRAARIGAAGHGGQVLLSGATAELVAGSLPAGVRLQDLGAHRLKDLEQPIRVHQLEIDGLQDRFPPIRSLDTARGNLPRQLTSFVGREREMATALELLAGHRLLTLTGPGGTGKTRLALETAHATRDQFADGAWFVDLAPVRDAGLVPLAISRALDVGVDPGGDALQAAINHLRHREALVVLDNFEQVMEARGAVAALVEATQGMTLLVTSREPLGIYGEQEFPVPPFGDADAVALFAERARSVRPDFSLTDANMATVERIVDHVAGLPLAVELAATQLRVLSLSALRERLEQHLPLPSATEGGRPERQQTMQRAIAWSYELLDEPERRLFRRLSLFPGGFSLAAAEAVGDDGADGPALDVLTGLVRKSLLRQIDTPDDEPRFRMLEPIAEFAAEQLHLDEDADNAHRRMADYWLAFAEEAEPHLTRHEQAVWLDRCEREAPNLRRALEWSIEAGEADIGMRIAAALWRFWHQRGPIQEGRDTLDRLTALPGGDPAVIGRAHGAAGGLAWWSGDFAATGRHFGTALSLLEGSGDATAEAEALYNAGFALVWQAVLAGGMDADRAEELFRRSLSLAEAIDDRRGMSRAVRGLGFVTGIARGDAPAAIPLFERSLALAEEAGDRWEMNESIIGIGNAHRFSGDRETAKRAYLQGIDLMAETGNRSVVIGLVLLLSALEVELGNHDRVVRLWGAAQAEREASGAISPPAAARLVGDPVAAARAAIGDEAADAGLAEGRAMDYEALVAYAHA